MDIGTTAITASLVIACALPFVIMYKNKSHHKHIIADELQQLAASTQGALTQKEVYGEFAIGLDEPSNHAYYYKYSKEGPTKLIADLTKMNRCEINITHSPFDAKNPKDHEIDRLDLTLHPIAKNETKVVFEFYNVDESFQLSDELELIEKWADLINRQISTGSTTSITNTRVQVAI